MRVLHLVAADRWTGAAAPAVQLVAALRGSDVDASLIFRGGGTLEDRLRRMAWAQPDMVKERSPAQLRSVIRMIRRRAATADVVHAHLPHDHILACLALTGSSTPLVRSIRHPRHLVPQPVYRWLIDRATGAAVANTALARQLKRVYGRMSAVLPPVVEPNFGPGPSRRSALAIPAAVVVAGAVGKLAAGRGQETFLRALALVPGVWGLVVGAGEHGRELRSLASDLGVAGRVVFTGYVESGLEEMYRAMDLFVFPAAGSDWGHRAIAEATACGIPVVAADLAGVRDLVVDGETGSVFQEGDEAALSRHLDAWARAGERRRVAGRAARVRALGWTAASLADAALRLYSEVVTEPFSGKKEFLLGRRG